MKRKPVVAIAALVVLKVVFALVGVALVLLFRLLPLVLIGWLAVKAWKWLRDRPRSITIDVETP